MAEAVAALQECSVEFAGRFRKFELMAEQLFGKGSR